MNDAARSSNAGANGGGGALLVPGFAAGLLGGAVMAGWMAAAAALDGADPLAPLRPMGDAFADGERGGGPAIVAFGLSLHLLVSGAVGVAFASVLPRDLEPRFASVVCVGFAFAVMAIMTSYVLPAWNPSLRAEMPELGGAWVLAHAAYGATVGLVAQALRRRSRAGQAPRQDARSRAHGRRTVAAGR